jgi:hypothetical protein
MRKSQNTLIPHTASLRDPAWIDVDPIASIDVSSEESDYPIESALLLGKNGGWRAANPGTQTIRLNFDQPQKLKRICLVFQDDDNSRTQEFMLRWSPDINGPYHEIVRQQWNFSPPHSVRETEDYTVELSGVKILELKIVPDKNGGEVHASLVSLRLV